jgi:hypothetical protein
MVQLDVLPALYGEHTQRVGAFTLKQVLLAVGVGASIGLPQLLHTVGARDFARVAQSLQVFEHALAMDPAGDADQAPTDGHVGDVGKGRGEVAGIALDGFAQTHADAISHAAQYRQLHDAVHPRDPAGQWREQ